MEEVLLTVVDKEIDLIISEKVTLMATEIGNQYGRERLQVIVWCSAVLCIHHSH